MSAHTDNSRVDDGGPAFPNVCMNDPCHPSSEPGMSLRDWFAGQALAGMLAEQRWVDSCIAAQWAFEYADAMLAARKGCDQ
jgi:hypothetical protein